MTKLLNITYVEGAKDKHTVAHRGTLQCKNSQWICSTPYLTGKQRRVRLIDNTPHILHECQYVPLTGWTQLQCDIWNNNGEDITTAEDLNTAVCEPAAKLQSIAELFEKKC